jgi:hypothetical protein
MRAAVPVIGFLSLLVASMLLLGLNGCGGGCTFNGSLSGPFRVRIEAWQRWGGVGQSFSGGLGSKRIQNVL